MLSFSNREDSDSKASFLAAFATGFAADFAFGFYSYSYSAALICTTILVGSSFSLVAAGAGFL